MPHTNDEHMMDDRPLTAIVDEPAAQPPLPRTAGNGGIGERFARGLTTFTGSTRGFLLALAGVLIWAALGPWFAFSEGWQLVINTSTTIITFLMVFLIQRAQNKDSLAIHLKLDELVAAHRGASNLLVSAEDLSEEDLERLQGEYRHLVQTAQNEPDPGCAHSIDERGAGAVRAAGGGGSVADSESPAARYRRRRTRRVRAQRR
jgi:low affinity Fe/Cu permease